MPYQFSISDYRTVEKIEGFAREVKAGNLFFLFFSEICWRKAMVAYTMPQQRKKEESERLKGERDQVQFIDLGFNRWKVVRFRKARERQNVP